MVTPDPPEDWQAAQHERILQHDATAFAELCESALPHLVAFLKARFPDADAHLGETVAIDLLLDYRRRPQQYKPDRLTLFGYLRMAAKYDMLNQLSKFHRVEERVRPIEETDVELRQLSWNTLQEDAEIGEWLEQHTDLTLREILVRVESRLNETEKRFLEMMLEGVRETAPYAVVLGVENEDEATQRRAVKRTKDRIMKRLRRLGEQVKRK